MALNTDAKEYLQRGLPEKTRAAYTRDWEVWIEFHDWLAQQTRVRLTVSDITVGTILAFVTYLDQVVKAPPNTVERRVIGTTSEARRRGCTVPQETSTAAWHAVKQLRRAARDQQQHASGRTSNAQPGDGPRPAPRKRR
ncbi:hypothetical protein [Streptomyces sp. 067-1]|uniref:hypothetical protein n=1 Tax=Streptomyces sp. 067-1 TaxID=2789269 RepID=UPI0039F526EE